MNSSLKQHVGFLPYKMDPKFRVSIPTGWRPEAGGSLFLLFSKRYEMPMVKVLSQAAFDEKVELIQKSDKTPAEKDKLLGKLAMLCREVSLNDQGKLLVPKDLSEKAGIKADGPVTLAGRGMHFEIWSQENFDRFLDLEMNEAAEDELGLF